MSPLPSDPELENPSARAEMRRAAADELHSSACRSDADRQANPSDDHHGPGESRTPDLEARRRSRLALHPHPARPARTERRSSTARSARISASAGSACGRPRASIRARALRLELRLFGGRSFTCLGHVCWSRVTLHPALLGTPKGMPDDARFGICFDGASTQDLLPIARLMVAREDARRRARRIRRLHGFPARA